MQRFLGTVPRDRENLLVLVVVAVGLGAVGPEAEHAASRVVLAHAASALILLRLVFDAVPALQAEYGRRVAWLLATPPALRGVWFAVLAVRQSLAPESSLELQGAMLGRGGVVLSFMAAAALFNFGFVALLTLRLVRRLQDQSLRDALTGVFNRRMLDQELSREWQRWRRGGSCFALLSLDLDHFKRINDTHGHLAGDRVLAQAAQRLVALARSIDTLARTGGEEFVLLLPQTDAVGARVVAERLRSAIGDLPFDLGGTLQRVTVSAGLVVAGQRDADVTQLLQRADKALYLAKADGRDRVVCDEPY
jgi:diguanylate cyclase (GGDEF)-like protein